MRTVQIVLASFAASLYGQPDPLAAIREALMATYTLTVATADKTAIVRDGSLLTLKKSDLLAGEVASPTVLANSYKFGKISRGFMGQVARAGSTGTRTFVAGEKLWVTDIEVKPKGIVFWLLSDNDSGVRYRASLNFPFSKAPPIPADAKALVGEVFEVEGSPAAGPSPVQETGDWDPRFGRITSEDLERIGDSTVQFDLNYFRLNPAALDQKPVMQYFAALNNCNNSEVQRALFNELDYPALASFYKARAPQILAPLSRIITGIEFDRFIGGGQSGNWRLWSKSLTLGEYDPQRRVFPLKYPGKDLVEIPDELSTDSGKRDLAKTCPAAQNAARLVRAQLPLKYEIAVRPASYRELPMDEMPARQYIDSAGPQRAVFLAMDVAILDSRPKIDQAGNSMGAAAFRAQVVRLRVMDSQTQKPLGALFDDGALRAKTKAAQAPAASAPKGSDWSYIDHMYDIRMSVYVSLTADACGWALTDDQGANLKRFLEQVSARGNFNERTQYNLVHSKIKNAIAGQGRMNFCANPSERRDFKKYAAMVTPLGPLAGGK